MDRLLLSLFATAAASSSDQVGFQLLELDSPISSLTFCGAEDSVLFALTAKNSVYRSENRGLSWKKLNEILEREGAGAVIGKQTAGQVEKIVVSPADAHLIAFIGSEGITWYSEDCGKTISALNHGRPIFEFKFHPRVKEWALAAAWTKCSDFQDVPCKIYKSLFVTQNLGKKWTQVSDYVVQFNWAQHSMIPFLQLQIPNTRIYITRLKDNSGNQVLKGWTHNVDLLQSDDFFKTSVVLVPRGNKFILAERFILVAQVVEEGSEEVQLLVSNERDLEKFYKPEVPIKKFPEHSYTLIDTSEESIVININHYGEGAEYGNVYISDSTGRRFALSLRHNVRNLQGVCDFIKVNGLEGIYVANVVDQDFTETQTQKNKKTKKTGTVKTYITFDKGGFWQPLTPPEREADGTLLRCDSEDCSLHLNGLTVDQYAPVYTTKNALGLLMAIGNVGSKLSERREDMNTYLSRDGGLNWLEVRKGSHIYEIGDHGALIVMALDQVSTDTILFSWNEGLTWETLKIAEEPLDVDNIVIEPGATSQGFILYGRRKGKGVTVAIDFSSLHEPQCRRPESPGEDGSDYELWSPNDGRAGSRCLMGRYIQYTRRKRESECYNGQEYERAIFVENCACTALDYECDIGYFIDQFQKCQRVANYEAEPQTCEEDLEYYEIQTGYRRVAGNSCEGGVRSQLEPLRVYCNQSSISSSGMIILTILAVIIILYTLSTRYERLKAWIDNLKGSYASQGFTSNLNFVPDSPDDEMFDKEAKHD